jgi:hypothetical protein
MSRSEFDLQVYDATFANWLLSIPLSQGLLGSSFGTVLVVSGHSQPNIITRSDRLDRSPGDEFILFTLKNKNDVDEVVNTFQEFGCNPVEKDGYESPLKTRFLIH